MSKIKENRVFGARGIRVINANLNSGFDGRPKTLGDGTFFNSDVSTKFIDRDYMQNAGGKVLIKKTLKLAEDGTPYACTLEETLNDKLSQDKSPYVQLLNNFVDVQNFGALATTYNFGITGVVQYHQGVNKLDSNVIVQDILSPFGTGNNKNNKDKKKKEEESGEEQGKNVSTNIGKHSFLDDALYVQGFSVNPSNLNNFVSVFNDNEFKGYKEESYDVFKKAVLMSATVFNTRSKAGCYDEFSIFVNVKKGSMYTLCDIGRYIDVTKDEDSNNVVIDFTKLSFLNDVADIDSIEIYHNTRSSIIKHNFKSDVVKDILTCL